MAEHDLSAEQVSELIERLKYQEQVLYQQIARIYAIEKRLGISEEPVKPVAAPPPAPALPIDVPSVPSLSAPPPVKLPVASPVTQDAYAGPTNPGLVEEAAAHASTAMPREDATASSPATPSNWFSLEGKDLEALIGGNWLSRIGILAIVLSAGFFLKLAFENQWIGPTGRIMIGVVLGLGFLVGGERIRTRGYRYYAHGLSGGGIAILYLVFFAAFARYQLIGQMPAFALMTLVTSAAVLLAARYDALAIAILGLIGGFLTPVMLSTGKDNQAGLFSYITLLDLGVLALAYFKQWRVLNYLAYGTTVLMSAAWLDQWYAPEKLRTTIFFFTVLFVIFALLAILYNVINRTLAEWPEIVLILLNAGFYFGASYTLLEPRQYPFLGLFAVVVSAFYLGLGYLTYSRDREDRYLILTFLGLASVFLTLAVPIQLNQHWVTMAWALEGVVLTWIGLRAESRLTRYAALLVFVISLLHWLGVDLGEFAFHRQTHFVPLFNRRAVSCIALIASLAGAAWLYLRQGEKVAERERMLLAGSFALAANAMAVLWLSLDLRDYFEQAKAPRLQRAFEEPWQWDAITRLDSLKHLLLTLLWCLYGGALMLIGLSRKVQPLRWAALLLLGLASFKVLTLDVQYAEAPWRTLVFNPAFGSFALLVATFAGIYWRYSQTDEAEVKERSVVLPVLLAAANLLALIGLSTEVNAHFAAKARGNETARILSLASTRQFALTALWSLYAAITMGIAVRGGNKWRGYKWLRIGALGLLALAAIKVVIVDLIQSVPGRTPLLNQTFAAFLIVIAALAYSHWLHSRDVEMNEQQRSRLVSILLVVTNLLGVFALSVESEGYFSARMGPLDYDSASWRDANLARQLWLSVIWGIYGGAMMVTGIWRRNRQLRWMALLLLGLTILKVFLVDLSALDNLYRVISFVVLGVVLLVVSFLYQKAQQRIAGGGQ